MNKYLIHDIETIPETEVAAEWEKDRDALIAKGNPNPFPPIQVHKVITIGMLVMDDDFLPVKGGCAAGGLAGGESEREMILRWSSVVSSTSPVLRLVDWNGRGFDVPVLQTRAFRYGIPLPWYFGLQPDNRGEISSYSKEYRDRYAGSHEDLAEIWTGRGAFPRPHMASLAALMGLPGKVGIDGSKVYETWKDYRHAKNVAEGRQPGPPGTPEQYESWRKRSVEIAQEIDTYCMQDVYQTAFIFQRYQYMAGKIKLSRYQEAAKALLDYVKKADPHLHGMIDVHAVLLQEV